MILKPEGAIVIAMKLKRKGFRGLLGVLMAACVTACLSAAIASATRTAAKSAHSCCPVSSQPGQDPGPVKTTAGVPSCCLVVTPSQVAQVVMVKIGLLSAVCAAPEGPLSVRGAAVEPFPDVLLQFLSKAVLAIRAPPRA